MAEERPLFRPAEILTALEQHQVEYVVIGAIAALAHGAPYGTRDIDITPKTDRANLQRLSKALTDLDARIRIVDDEEAPTLQFAHDAAFLEHQAILNVATRAGNLDICLVPAGTSGYTDLRRDAVRIEILGQRPRVASLADVIRSKEAANRPKDQVTLPLLREMLGQQTREPARPSKDPPPAPSSQGPALAAQAYPQRPAPEAGRPADTSRHVGSGKPPESPHRRSR